MTTDDGVEFVRTPDACFEGLPDWPYPPQYVEIQGLRQGYVDVGPADAEETILLLHGQPSWSYLYRKMIPVLADDGHRVIAMDHVGMGRSDKPIDPDYYTYEGHVERLEAFIQELELEQGNLTIFVQDWGSLIGLQVVGTHPDWFDRVVVGNGFLPTFPADSTPAPLPENPEVTRNLFHQNFTNMPAQQEPLVREETSASELSLGESYFGVWIDYARNDERFRPEQIVESLTYFDLSPQEEAAYAAPFPSRIAMGGPRAFPGLINQLAGVTDSGWAGLGEYENPFLTIWGDNDPGNLGQPFIQQSLLTHVPGSQGWDHVRLEEASHFLQDDQGEEIAHRVNEFIAQTRGSDDSASAVEVTPLQDDVIPAVEQSQSLMPPRDLRNFRYCEVLALAPAAAGVTVNVYSTMGLSDCPAVLFDDLDADAIADEYGLMQAQLNGPRYWLMNSMSSEGMSRGGQIADFGGIEMRLNGQLTLDPNDMASSTSAPYAPREVNRDTTFVYDAGSMVYELISPEGDVYRMQSYTQAIEPTLTIDDLETLGERLELPDGWRFEARVLAEESEVVAVDSIAHVINDDLNNTYQLVAGLSS